MSTTDPRCGRCNRPTHNGPCPNYTAQVEAERDKAIAERDELQQRIDEVLRVLPPSGHGMVSDAVVRAILAGRVGSSSLAAGPALAAWEDEDGASHWASCDGAHCDGCLTGETS